MTITEEEILKAKAHQIATGGPTPDHPIPERKETIEAQIRWLVAGKRRVVYLPKGSYIPPVPEGMDSIEREMGMFIFNPILIKSAAIDRSVNNGFLGYVLGYGIDKKPRLDETIGAVVIRGKDGIEKQAVVVDNAHLQQVFLCSSLLADPGDSICFEKTDKVIEGRKI